MFIKIFACLIFSVTATQACLNPHVLRTPTNHSCVIRLSSNKAITAAAEKKYEEFYKELKNKLNEDSNPGLINELSANHTRFVNEMAALLEEYDDDIEELKLIHNQQNRERLCKQFLNSTMRKTIEMQKSAENMRGVLLEFLDKHGSKWWNYKNLKRKLHRAINLFFMVDLTWKITLKLLEWYERATKVVDGELPTEDSVLNHQADVNRFVEVVNDLMDDQPLDIDIGTNNVRTVDNEVSEFLSHLQSEQEAQSVDTLKAAEAAKAKVAVKTAESWRATEAAVGAEESQAAELLEAARDAEAARAAETIRAAEAARAVEAVRVAQATRFIETTRAAESAREAQLIRFAANAGTFESNVGLAATPAVTTGISLTPILSLFVLG